jgi:hypothetical protein
LQYHTVFLFLFLAFILFDFIHPLFLDFHCMIFSLLLLPSI